MIRKLTTTIERLKFEVADWEDDQEFAKIPDHLAAVSVDLIIAHRANGDLDWLEDMIEELR